MKIKLQNSGVIFNQEDHRYFLNGKELKGITGLIKAQLFPNKYKDIPQYILERAAERGSFVHESIELYDGGFEPAESSSELNNYKRIKAAKGFETLVNEYLVTDREYFASAIDLVFTNNVEEIILADIKTTSVLDKEYCRWQLSIYAYLFELQNPTLKVSELYAIWLRGEDSEIVKLERIDSSTIKDLLQCEIDGRKFISPLIKVEESENIPTEIKEAEFEVYTLIKQIKELDAKKKELSKGLLKVMQDSGVKSYKGEYISLSRKEAYIREDIDKEKLKRDYPNVYADCIKHTKIKESIQIK